MKEEEEKKKKDLEDALDLFSSKTPTKEEIDLSKIQPIDDDSDFWYEKDDADRIDLSDDIDKIIESQKGAKKD